MAGQPLVKRLFLVLRVLSVLGFVHFVLPGADQSQRNSPVAFESDAAMAEGRKRRADGQLTSALQSFKRSAALAHSIDDARREANALTAVSGVEIRLFEYGDAVQAAILAKSLAQEAQDDTIAGAAAGNASAVFAALGDLERARAEALQAAEHLEKSSNERFYAKASLALATLDFEQKNYTRGEAELQKTIEAARATSDVRLEATAWDDYGALLLAEEAGSGDQSLLATAQTSLRKAYSLRVQIGDASEISLSKLDLAQLELQKPDGNLRLALRWIDEILASPARHITGVPDYIAIHLRAKLLEKVNDPGALGEYYRAVSAADEWRQSALPGDITNTQTVAWVHEVYADFARFAAGIALRRNNRTLARRALQVLAENRAASLREQLTATRSRNLLLPEQYFHVLSELELAQAQVTLGSNTKQDRARLQVIQNTLQDLENNFDSSNRVLSPYRERNSFQNSLRDIQLRLDKRELLLSFCLGKEKSFLWSLTRTGFNLYELPQQSEIENAARTFTEDVRAGRHSSVSGQRLSQDLFGSLPVSARNKPDWLLVPDGALLDCVPFAALPISAGSLRLLPSELLLLRSHADVPSPRFVGIADPIYNLADARRTVSLSPVQDAASPVEGHLILARLAGSNREVARAAEASAIREVNLLTGPAANGEAVAAALAKHPAIVHFAVHIVSPEGKPQNAALALSLTQDGMPELLTPELIATYRVPGSLVVLSGCASEQGKLLPGAGLIGISRAWLLAGASAVLVSAWPTPDDSGSFFSSFYRHLQALRSGRLAQSAALALHQTQVEMQHTSGHRSSPSFWAAYSIISEE